MDASVKHSSKISPLLLTIASKLRFYLRILTNYPNHYALKYVKRKAGKEIRDFRSLKSIDPNVKQRHFYDVLHNFSRMALISARTDLFWRPLAYIISMYWYFFSVIYFPQIYGPLFLHEYDLDTQALIIILATFSIAFINIRYTRLINLFMRSVSKTITYIMVPVFLLTSTLVYLILSSVHTLPGNRIVLLTCTLFLTSLAFWSAYMLVFLFLTKILWQTTLSISRSNIPRGELTWLLVAMLRQLETSPRSWNYLGTRQYTLRGLELVANCVENNLYGYLKTGDDASNEWLKETMQGIAASVREHKKWIVTPKSDTYEEFIKYLSQTLGCVLNGNWDELEQMKITVSLRSGIMRRTVDFVRAVAIGALPLLVFWGLQQTQLLPSGTLSDVITVLLLGWFLISLFPAIDPDYRSKLDAAKDLKDFLPFR